MDDQKVKDFLEHHGVKGQKWGVRKDRGHEGQRTKTKKIDKLDKKFEKSATSLDTALKVYNRATELSNKDLVGINKKYEGNNFLKDSPVRRKYYKEVQDSFMKNLETSASELGSNASGSKKYSILEGPNGGWAVRTTDIQHADQTFNVDVTYDENGFITDLEIANPIEHSVDAFLEHHGVKGQKWGVRRTKKALHKARQEHIKSLTTPELKEHVNRLELEKRASELSKEPPGPVKSLIKKHGGQAISVAVGAASSAAVSRVLKKAMSK